jgi:hypothetical protein
MFKIGLRSALGAITNACVAQRLKQLNRGHVLYLFGSHIVQTKSYLRLYYNIMFYVIGRSSVSTRTWPPFCHMRNI